MKVGIASCYYNHNYGSMLQAYATQKAVEKLGHEAITIQCNAPITYMTQSKVKYYYRKLTNLDIVKTKIRQYESKSKMKKHPEIQGNIVKRDQCFENFYRKYIRLSEKNDDRTALTNFAKTCAAVVVGSDMLWHPVNVEHDYYTLTFVPDPVLRVAYSTSFGTTKIPAYQKSEYQTFLKRFSAISVREKSGIDVINNLGIGKEATVVLDPTLLFSGIEWMEIQQKKPIIENQYILCYFLGVNQEHRKFAQKMKKLTGYQIVALQHLDEYVEEDVGYADISAYDIGPAEFINLIRNAEYVCTDSFHGSCFAILNHKKFFTFNRFQTKNSQSTNTRIDSLLQLVGLEDRRVNHNIHEKQLRGELEQEIDYAVVDKKLDIERERSLCFLEKALKADQVRSSYVI